MATVSLASAEDYTILGYQADAAVGGKFPQLIDSTARKLADQFFSGFDAQVSAAIPAPTAA